MTVTRSGNSDQTVEVDYQSSAGTATAAWTTTTCSAHWFSRPAVEEDIPSLVTNDEAIEPSETLSLQLGTPRVVGDPTGLAPHLAEASAVLHIVSDDQWAPGSFELAQPVFSVNENAGSVTVTIKRSAGRAVRPRRFATGPRATPRSRRGFANTGPPVPHGHRRSGDGRRRLYGGDTVDFLCRRRNRRRRWYIPILDDSCSRRTKD